MNVSEELIREIVQKVLAEAKQQESGEDFVKEKDPSGIIKIATETVKCAGRCGTERRGNP